VYRFIFVCGFSPFKMKNPLPPLMDDLPKKKILLFIENWKNPFWPHVSRSIAITPFGNGNFNVFIISPVVRATLVKVNHVYKNDLKI